MSEILSAKVARSRLGSIIRFRPEDAEAITRARELLAAAKLKDAVIRALNADPSPSREQLHEITGILASSTTNVQSSPHSSEGGRHV